jgi:DNA primase
LDFVAKAPDGKEVEEITKKEIHIALRGKIAAEQAKMELSNGHDEHKPAEKQYSSRPSAPQRPQYRSRPSAPQRSGSYRKPSVTISPDEKAKFKTMLEDLIGTRGAYILDEKLNIMGKVPITELATTIKSLNTGIYAVIFDGMIEKPLVEVAESARIKFVIAMKTKVDDASARVKILTETDL